MEGAAIAKAKETNVGRQRSENNVASEDDVTCPGLAAAAARRRGDLGRQVRARL